MRSLVILSGAAVAVAAVLGAPGAALAADRATAYQVALNAFSPGWLNVDVSPGAAVPLAGGKPFAIGLRPTDGQHLDCDRLQTYEPGIFVDCTVDRVVISGPELSGSGVGVDLYTVEGRDVTAEGYFWSQETGQFLDLEIHP